jgi:tetratricopeptide (TPR) repeat protein
MRFRLPLIASLAATALLAAVPARAQKDQVWTEVRSPNFVVVTSSGEKQGRNIAEQFEAFRSSFAQLFPSARVDLGKPLTIFAVKNERGLRELLPAYWETKGRAQPAGIFVPGEEKLYVALRTDTQGEFPYQVVYHEYAHALLRLNFRDLPAWLDEGLAEIFGNSLISNREVTMGRPSSYHLMLLQENRAKLLPVDALLAVDHQSPHYTEEGKKAIFYAQSWTLTHYIYLSKPGREANLFQNYLNAYLKGTSSTQAAQVFGDLKQLQRTLDDYIHQNLYFSIKTKPAAGIDKDTFTVRALAPAESAALRGDFYVHTNRPNEARAALDEALRLNPSSAQAHESMGILHLRQQNLEEALGWFEKAAALDSRSFLTHYFAALMGVMRGLPDSEFDKIEASLLKSIELNKDFAPAFSTLANLYSAREEKLPDALKMARRAAQLEPGVLLHHINVANVLLRMDQVDEAVQLARSVAAAAKEPTERASAESFLREAERYVAERKAYEAARKEAEERAARRAAEIAAWEKAAAEREAELRIAHENVVDPDGRQGVARGTIAEVTCPGARALRLNLTLTASTLQFRAANRTQVAYYLSGPQVSGSRNFNPCKELAGQRAMVIYRPVKGQPHAGEILAVELPAEGIAANPAPASDPGKITAAVPSTIGTLAEGRAAAVSCTGPDLVIGVDFGGITIRMRADDRARVEFTLRGGPMPATFNPCTDLRGKNVGVVYKQQDVPGGFAGLILSVDVQQ